MPLEPGTSIGPYFVDREIGRGGMGVVYLARDPRLQRNVAIKALPDHLASDPERLDRFRSEAQALAQLSHPAIAGIHGVEEQDGASYLVLEYVEGETLSDRLARGPFPVDEAIELGIRIATGIEAAHEAGVVHRDLKPDNIRLTPEGEVKILDFGLAKIGDGASTTSGLTETVARPAQHSPTMPGVIMGTAAYMSPEQARGRGVDRRTDVWAFGVVLFECLTGASPFAGESASDSIGAVLHKEVDFDRLPADTPPHVRRILDRCLQRDKARRTRDMGDVRLDLESPADGAASPTGAGGRSRKLVLALALIAMLATGGWLITALRTPTVTPDEPTYLSIDLPEGMEIVGSIDISRDGQRVVFSGVQDGEQWIYVRDLGSFALRRIEGSRDGWNPRLSPDGASVLFNQNGAILRAQVSGGLPVFVAPSRWLTADWDEDDSILYSSGYSSPLRRMPAGGGPSEAVTDLNVDGAYAHVWPDRIGGTRKALFTVWSGDDHGGAHIVDLDTRQWRSIGPDDSVRRFTPPARWSPSGHLIFENWDAGLRVIEFDPESDATVSVADSRPLLEGVYNLGNSTRSVFAISDDGTFVYAPSTFGRGSRLVWVDESGAVTPIVGQSEISGGRLGGRVALSRDGSKVYIGGGGDVVEIDLGRGIGRPVTVGASNDLYPILFPSGDRILYASNEKERWSMWAVGLGPAATSEMILQRDESIYPSDISDDGMIVFQEASSETGSDLHLLMPNGEIRALATSPSDEARAHFSVDGRWVAYQSNGSGRDEVYVTMADGSTSPVQVTVGGGEAPRFGPGGNTLYFRRHRQVLRVDFVDGRPVGDPVRVFDAPDLIGGAAYDFDADESRMITVQVDPQSIPRELRVITSFFTVIEDVMASGRN
jgi:serine/threonine protein kinase